MSEAPPESEAVQKERRILRACAEQISQIALQRQILDEAAEQAQILKEWHEQKLEGLLKAMPAGP